VDADGRNFRVIDPYNAAVTHIYPPAWLNPNTVAVAVGPSLVLFNLSSGEKVWWDEDLPGAGTGSEPGKADMPRITHSFLLYRYTPDDIGDGPIIRMAELEYLPNTWIPDIKPWTDWQAPPAARPTFVHTDIRARFEQPTLSYGTPHIDYYTASLTNGIVISWYNHELPESLFVNFNFDFDAYNNGNINGTSTCAAPGCYPMYTEAGYPLIDGARGNPAWALRSANPWDYDPNAPTFRHALRKTVERTP
jgi:hypothetical protein